MKTYYNFFYDFFLEYWQFINVLSTWHNEPFLFSLKPSIHNNVIDYTFVNKNEAFIFFSLLDHSRIQELWQHSYLHKPNKLDDLIQRTDRSNSVGHSETSSEHQYLLYFARGNSYDCATAWPTSLHL